MTTTQTADDIDLAAYQADESGWAPPLSDRDIRSLHERFMADPGGTDLSALRPVIARSWSRSMACSVSADRDGLSEFREHRLDEQVRQCAEPVVAKLEQMSALTGGYICVSDPDATIALIRGGPTRRMTPNRFAIPGGVIAEDVVGTNGDGTAVEEKSPVQVWGAEHFMTEMHGFCCTSVPILDPFRNSLRAVLTISLPAAVAREVDRRSVALAAQGAAAEVARELAARLTPREQTLLRSYLSESRKRGAEYVVVMDDHTTIANRNASRLLGAEDYAALAGYAREARRAQRPIEREVVLESASVLRVQARPILYGGEAVGDVIRLHHAPQDPRLGAPARPVRRRDQFTALLGDSRPLLRTLDTACTAVRRGLPVCITGDRGTGKALLAQNMATQRANEVRTWDAAKPGGTGAMSEDAVADALSRGAAVVLCHIDTLPADRLRSLRATIAQFDEPVVVATATSLRSDVAELLSAFDGVEIEMPALRSRREDIPVLARHFLRAARPGARLTPALLASLAEADWGGNVIQLKEFIESLLVRVTDDEIGPQHLSDAHRRVLARTPLTRLEEAELRQITIALIEARGNRAKAASLLEIGRSTLYRKIEMYTRRGLDLSF